MLHFCVTFVVMLQILHKIIALIVMLAVLLSSMSFTVAKHVCMGEVTDVSYYQEAEGCGMEAKSCDEDDYFAGDQVRKQACCDNINDLIPGEPAEQQALDLVELQNFESAIQVFYTFPVFEQELEREVLTFDTGPPIVEGDIRVRFQRFLI